MSSISDQDPAYHKFGQEISISLEDFLNGFGEFDFPFFHFHGIGHQIKMRRHHWKEGLILMGQIPMMPLISSLHSQRQMMKLVH